MHAVTMLSHSFSSRALGLIAGLALALSVAWSVQAQTTSLVVDPATQQVGSVGQTFTVDWRFQDYQDLGSFSLVLYYNPSVIQHTSFSNLGALFGAGNDFFCRLSTESTTEGEIALDCPCSDGTSSCSVTGADGLAVTLTFESVGSGTSNLLYDDTGFEVFRPPVDPTTGQGRFLRVRDSNNQDIPVDLVPGSVTVTSPLPVATRTRDYDEGDDESAFPSPDATKARSRATVVPNVPGEGGSGEPNEGYKTTMALYEEEPPGGDLVPFNDPDGQVAIFNVLDRYWEFATSFSGIYQIDLAFSYSGLDLNDNVSGIPVPSELRACQRTIGEDGSGEWQIVPVAQTSVDETNEEVIITAAGSSEFGTGQYAICGDTGNLLPVELVTFDALLDGDEVVLRWRTASETNNAGFEVQQRPPAEETEDDPEWRSTGFVEGMGTTATPQRYRHRVDELAPGHHVFRLKQVDFDGTFEYSPELEVVVATSDDYHLSPPYPNPLRGPGQRAHFSLSVAQDQHVVVDVVDLLGRRVARLFEGTMTANRSKSFTFDADQLPTGMYQIRSRGAYFSASTSLVVVR